MDAREQFVIAWQQSGSVREVAGKLRMDTHAVNCRATHLRHRGVPLKQMPYTRPPRMGPNIPPVEIVRLSAICRQYGPKADCLQCGRITAWADMDTYDAESCRECIARVDAEMVKEAEREGYCDESTADAGASAAR